MIKTRVYKIWRSDENVSKIVSKIVSDNAPNEYRTGTHASQRLLRKHSPE